MTTPPTEDRDWKESLQVEVMEDYLRDAELMRDDEVKITTLRGHFEKLCDFISQEITTAEARGRHETLEQLAGKTPIDTLYVPRRDGKEAVWKLIEIKPLA